MGLSGVQFNLMNTGVVSVAGIGWHEALSPIKFKTITISVVVLWVSIKLKDFVLVFFSVHSFPGSLIFPPSKSNRRDTGTCTQWESRKIIDLGMRLNFPNYFNNLFILQKCNGVFSQGWRAMLPNEVNVPHKTINQLMVSPKRLILI